jgi:Tfp pilus assembly PilM family ATPase
MSTHIGLAFCVDKIYYAGFVPIDQSLALDRLGSLNYPFRYDEPELFNDNSFSKLVNLIKSDLLTDQDKGANLSISIESNLAELKRISLPDNFNKSEAKEHIIWDLSQSLLEPVDHYIFYRTDNFFVTNNRKDFLTIAIKKNIVQFFKKLSNEAGLSLADISINQLVTEFTLFSFLKEQAKGLVILFKITPKKLESTYFWNGSFYSYNYERLIGYPLGKEYVEELLKNIRAKIKQMENLFEQFIQNEVKVDQIFIYGDSVNDSILSLIKENLSVIPTRLNPIRNIEKSERMSNTIPSEEEASNYVESIGVVLDR